MRPAQLNPVLQQVLHKRSDLHILRKVWHMALGGLGLIFYYQTGEQARLWGWIALSISIAGFAIDLIRMKVPALNAIVIKMLGPFMRNSERDGLSGLPFYALGISIALLVYSQKIALLAIMFLVFSDPISSFFGIVYGKDKIMPNKSLQGAMAGFFTCYLVTLFYGMAYGAHSSELLWFSILGGVIGSISEMLSAFNVDDNLTIPVVSGLGLSIFNYILEVL